MPNRKPTPRRFAASPPSAGQRLQSLRTVRSWTQEELARKITVSKSFLSEIENDHAVPGGEVLLRLAEIFGTTTDYILRGTSANTASPEAASISIPAELDALAKDINLSYQATVALVNARRSVVAHRGEKSVWTKQDWKELYDKLRDYLK